MNKIYKVIWSKVRNCYVAVSEIAKRNGKSCTSVNCGVKSNRGHAGVALAIALSLSMASGGVAWAAVIDVPNDEYANPITINDDQSSNTYNITADNISFTVTGTGKVGRITSEKSGNTLEIKSGGQSTISSGSIYIGVSNNTVTVAGSLAGGIWGGYGNSNNVDVTNNKVTISGTVGSGNSGNALHGGLANGGNSGNVMKNAVLIDGGTVNTKSVTGGYSLDDDANNSCYENTVTIKNGKVYTTDEYGIYGGRFYSGSGSVINNSVTISGTSIIGKSNTERTIVYGGKASSGIAEKNKVEISGGTIYADVYGGHSDSGTVGDINKGNTVSITGGTVNGSV